MRTFSKFVRGAAFVTAFFATAAILQADILNINDFWSNSTTNVAVADTTAHPVLVNGSIELTNTLQDESRTIFDNTAQTIGHFTASFTYHEVGGFIGDGTGITFVIQNVPAGTHAVGSFSPVENAGLGFLDLGAGGGLGFPPTQSMGLSLELSPGSGTGLYQSGLVNAGGAFSIAPINLLSGDPVRVDLSYSSPVLNETITDLTTQATFTLSNNINLPALMQGPTAFVGFSGGSSGPGTANDQQFISDFSYRTPEPSSLVLAGIAALGLLAYARRKAK